MDHTDAVKLQAVEKYILGELAPSLRNEFEAHYFECAECSLNVRSGVAFAAASRQYFAEMDNRPVVVPAPKPGWFAWLKPLIAVPAFAALLFLIGYQNLVTIPRLHRESGAEATAVEPWFSLVPTNVRGGGTPTFSVVPGQGFSLVFDITAAHSDPSASFLLQLQDASGKTLLTRTVSSQAARRSVHLRIPPGLSEGSYRLLITKQFGGTAAGEIPFDIAFSSQVKQD